MIGECCSIESTEQRKCNFLSGEKGIELGKSLNLLLSNRGSCGNEESKGSGMRR